MVDVFKKRSRIHAENFFQSLKPKIYSDEMTKNFDLLEGVVEEEQKTFKWLVRRELDERRRIKLVQNNYLGTVRKPSA